MQTSEAEIETIQEVPVVCEENIPANKDENIHPRKRVYMILTQLIALSLFVLMLISKTKSMPLESNPVTTDLHQVWQEGAGFFADTKSAGGSVKESFSLTRLAGLIEQITRGDFIREQWDIIKKQTLYKK